MDPGINVCGVLLADLRELIFGLQQPVAGKQRYCFIFTIADIGLSLHVPAISVRSGF